MRFSSSSLHRHMLFSVMGLFCIVADVLKKGAGGMAVVNVPASKSLTLSSKTPLKNIKQNKIFIGGQGRYVYYSYLFFNIDMIPGNISLLAANLVLFKTGKLQETRRFAIYPLLQEFCSLTTYLHSCPFEVCPALRRTFNVSAKDIVVETDITGLFGKWLDNTLVNRGIAIIEENFNFKTTGRASFGSAYSKDKTLIPYIRVMYKEKEQPFYFPIPNMGYCATPIPCKS